MAEPPVLRRVARASARKRGHTRLSTARATATSRSRRAGLSPIPGAAAATTATGRSSPAPRSAGLPLARRGNSGDSWPLLRSNNIRTPPVCCMDGCGRGRLGQAPGGQRVAAGVQAGAGGEIELEVVPETADYPIPDRAADGEILACMRAVAGDLIAAAGSVHHDLLVA